MFDQVYEGCLYAVAWNAGKIMTMIALFVASLGASDCNQNNRIC